MKTFSKLTIALLIAAAAGCAQVPEPGDLPPPPPELQPGGSTAAGGTDARQVCLTINTEVNVINARGMRRVETDGVSFVTNSGAARIESAGRVLYDNVRIVPSCEGETVPDADELTAQADDLADDDDPTATPDAALDNSAVAIPIPGGGVIPAAGDGGGFSNTGGGSFGGGGGGGGGGGIGSAGIMAALAGAGGTSFGVSGGAAPTVTATPRSGPPIASPSIPGN